MPYVKDDQWQAFNQWLNSTWGAANAANPPPVAGAATGNFPPPTNTTPPGYGTGANQGQPAGGLVPTAVGAGTHAAGSAVGNALMGGSSQIPGAPISGAAGPSLPIPSMPGLPIAPSASGVDAAGGVGNGATSMAGVTGAANVTQSPWALSGIGSAGNAYLPIAGTVGAVDVLSHGNQYSPGHSGLEGAASGAAIGSYFGPWGAGIGAGVGGLAGLLASQFGHGPNYYDANKRGKAIGGLIDSGFLQAEPGGVITKGGRSFPQGSVELADGSRYNIGGDEQITRVGSDGKQLHAYDVDFGNGTDIGNVVAAINPIAGYLAKGDKKLTRDLAGYLTNAAVSSGDVMGNVRNFYRSLGMGHDQIYGAIVEMQKSGQLDDERANAYRNGLDQLYSVGAFAPGGKPKPANQATPAASQPVPAAPNQPAPRDTNVMPPRGPVATPPQGTAGNAQPIVPPRGGSPFVGSPLNGGSKPGGIMGRQRLSPGVWQDQKGQYLSKTGVRGQ